MEQAKISTVCENGISKLLRLPEVMELIPIGRSTI